MLLTPDALYLGGNFVSALSSNVLKLTADGSAEASDNFNSANPIGNTQQVDTLALVNGRLLVGGSFSAPSGDLIALDPVAGTAVTDFAITTGFGGRGANAVVALSAAGGLLFVGGSFDAYQGYSVHNLMRYDTALDAIDASFAPNAGDATQCDGSGVCAAIEALTVESGFVYAGGFTENVGGTHIAFLDRFGATTGLKDPGFTSASGGDIGEVRALLVKAGELYVGGTFSSYALDTCSVGFATLTETGAYVDTYRYRLAFGGSNGQMFAMVNAFGAVTLGGHFDDFKVFTPAHPCSGAALYDYSGLENVWAYYQANSSVPRPSIFDIVYSFADIPSSPTSVAIGSAIYSGEGYDLIFEDGPSDFITPTSHASPQLGPYLGTPTGPAARAMAYVTAGVTPELYVGGNFSTVNGFASGPLVRLVGTTGQYPGSPPSNPPLAFAADPNFSLDFGLDAQVNALLYDNGVLYVGGTFTHFQGQLASGLVIIDSASPEGL